MTVTIVGGPHDGQRIGVTELLPAIQLSTFPKLSYKVGELMEDAPSHEVFTYVPMEFACQGDRRFIYRWEGISQLTAFHLLFSGYRMSPTDPTEQKEKQ